MYGAYNFDIFSLKGVDVEITLDPTQSVNNYFVSVFGSLCQHEAFSISPLIKG